MVFCNFEAERDIETFRKCHNPYFNRWFSAMVKSNCVITPKGVVTILILIDGFLQYGYYEPIRETDYKSQSLF